MVWQMILHMVPLYAVETSQICSRPALMRTFDIKTMKKEDADFTSSFVITTSRKDYVHALVAYFDVFFNDCHKPIGFSTSPMCVL